MQILSKFRIGLCVIIASLVAIIFLSYQPFCVYASQVESVDETIFNLSYKNKIWTFKGSDFNIDSNIFTIKERINKFGKNINKINKEIVLKKLIEIKITPEIAFNYIYPGFNTKINKICKNIEKKPQNAQITINKYKLEIKNEIIGIKINKNLFYSNLIDLYLNNKIINIEIPVHETAPLITKDTISKYTNKRSEFSTSIATSNSNRKFNVRKALNCINGTCLLKGEKFSFNNVVGRRSEDRGYKSAKIIIDGEFVDGTGGGVCQVSTTLYNAVLLAGLKVVKAQKHSQPVSYVKSGFDAMVNYGTSDLVFENNTNEKVCILCNYTNDKISISIYGESLLNVSFARESEIVDCVKSDELVVKYDTVGKYLDKVKYTDEYFELKPPRDGYTVKSYLVTLIDGVKTDRKLLRTDVYKPQNKVLIYGTHNRDECTILIDS